MDAMHVVRMALTHTAPATGSNLAATGTAQRGAAAVNRTREVPAREDA
jgi:hypothetical protein